jgi:hypothetical protein
MSQSQVYLDPLRDLVARRAAFQVGFEGFPGGEALRSRALRSVADEALDLATRLQQRLAPRDTVQEITEFAVETWPGAAKTFRYRAIHRRERLGSHDLPAVNFADRAVFGVWRRGRRYRKERWLREVASLPPAR